jgi:hypothetical protein
LVSKIRPVTQIKLKRKKKGLKVPFEIKNWTIMVKERLGFTRRIRACGLELSECSIPIKLAPKGFTRCKTTMAYIYIHKLILDGYMSDTQWVSWEKNDNMFF